MLRHDIGELQGERDGISFFRPVAALIAAGVLAVLAVIGFSFAAVESESNGRSTDLYVSTGVSVLAAGLGAWGGLQTYWRSERIDALNVQVNDLSVRLATQEGVGRPVDSASVPGPTDLTSIIAPPTAPAAPTWETGFRTALDRAKAQAAKDSGAASENHRDGGYTFAEWQTFTSDAGRISVKFPPVAPVEQTSTTWETWLGPADGLFGVSYSDLPAGSVTSAPLESLVAALGVTSFKESTFGAGRMIIATDGPWTIRGVVVVVGHRCYELWSIGQSVTYATAVSFFKSFAISPDDQQ